MVPEIAGCRMRLLRLHCALLRHPLEERGASFRIPLVDEPHRLEALLLVLPPEAERDDVVHVEGAEMPLGAGCYVPEPFQASRAPGRAVEAGMHRARRGKVVHAGCRGYALPPHPVGRAGAAEADGMDAPHLLPVPLLAGIGDHRLYLCVAPAVRVLQAD